LVKCSRDPGESDGNVVVGVGALTVVVTTGGMIQPICEDGTGNVAVEFNNGEEDVECEEVVAVVSRFAFDDGDVAVERAGVVAAPFVVFNIDTGQKDGWGVAAGGINVPFAKVSVKVPPAPPEIALGNERIDTEVDGLTVVDAFTPELEPAPEAAFEVVVPLLLGVEDEAKYWFPRVAALLELAACDRAFREFSAWGI